MKRQLHLNLFIHAAATMRRRGAILPPPRWR
jgi:hypothetical protein